MQSLNKITTSEEAAIQSARLVNYFMDLSSQSGVGEAPDVVMIGALATAYESLAKAAVTGIEVVSIVHHSKPLEESALERVHRIVRRALVGALITYQRRDPVDSLRHFDAIEELVAENKKALLEIAEEQVATKVQDNPEDPLVNDWKEGETKRMVGNTLVYRTYADKVMD